MRKHNRTLCEYCVADFPLNPAESAQTYSRRLDTVHRLADKKVAAKFLMMVLVACLLPIVAPTELAGPGPDPLAGLPGLGGLRGARAA